MSAKSFRSLRRGLSRRDFLRLGGASLGTAMLSRYLPGASVFAQGDRVLREPPPELLPKASSGGLGDTEIVVASMAGPDINAHIRNAERFTEYTQGTVKVRIEAIGRDVWNETMLTNMQAGSTAWDVLAIHLGTFWTGAGAGWWVPMSNLFDNSQLINPDVYDIGDFADRSLGLVTWDDELLALPQHVSGQMMFYRADMLEKYDVEAPDPLAGWSFDQLEAACRKLKTALANDGMDQTWPLVLLLANAPIVLYNFAASMGTPLYDADSLPQYNSAEAVAALELIKAWMDEGLISPGALGYNYPEGIETLRQEKTVIALQWDTAAVELTDPGASPTTADTLDFTVHPWDANIGHNAPRVWTGVWSNFVSKFSQNSEAALSYSAWYTSKEIAYDYVRYGGGHSGRASLLTDPEILAARRQYDSMIANFGAAAILPTLAQLGYVGGNILVPNLQAFLTGVVDSAQAAMDTAQEEAVQFLQDEGVM